MRNTRYSVNVFTTILPQIMVRRAIGQDYCAYFENCSQDNSRMVTSSSLMELAAKVSGEMFDKAQGMDEGRSYVMDYLPPNMSNRRARALTNSEYMVFARAMEKQVAKRESKQLRSIRRINGHRHRR